MTPAGLWIILFQYPDHFFGTVAGLFGFTLLFGIPAVSIGWVFQCLIVIATHSFKKTPGEE